MLSPFHEFNSFSHQVFYRHLFDSLQISNETSLEIDFQDTPSNV
jgi:hypothetical protein